MNINCTACNRLLHPKTTLGVKYTCRAKCQSLEMVSDYYFELNIFNQKLDLCFAPFLLENKWITLYIDFIMNRTIIYHSGHNAEVIKFITPNFRLASFNQDIQDFLQQYSKLRAFQ